MVSDDGWMDSAALTDDTIKSTWDQKSPARKEADKAIRQSLAKFQGLVSASAAADSGGKVVNQQGQPENKKNRFSLNFLRASLLSPKDSTAAKGESIFRQSAPEAFQASVKQPETDRGAATRVDSNTSAAQSYSPLGQGAAAFTPPSPGMPAMEKQLKPLRLSIANSTMDAWTDDANTDSGGDTPARSPLRALSSNSPTRRSLSSFSKSADLQASLNQGLPLLSRTLPVSSRSDAQSRAFSFKPSSESQALNLSRQPQHQHSPLPPNALVAYSSDDTDEDDCRSGVDATERIEFEPITGPGKPAVNDGAASVASYHSDASTAEAAGDLYQIEELVPSALMMTPSASLENDDAQYEPTMSPSAFQAALAAGIFAAQRQPLPADTQLAKPVSLVLTPLRDARVEVALTCTDEAAPLQPAFDSQQNVSSAVAAVPDKLAAVPALAQYDLESSSPATAQQDAETSAFTLLDAGIAEVQSPAAVMPAAAETSSQQADLSVPTSLQDVPSVPSIDVISQDAQVVLDQVAAESPRAAASATAEPQESATEQPAAASSASGQQTVAGAKPDQLLGHPNTDRPTENSSPKLQGRTDPSMSGRIVLPHCSKRYAEEQLDCQPFFKAPRVPPAETPGIPRPIADITADPGSPLPKQQAAQLDIFVDSFIDNIISAVKLELTAAALTVEADSDSTASATHAESSAPSTVQMKQNQAEADVEPIPAVSPSQPIAATQLDSSPPRQQAPVQSQQQSVAEAKPAPVTTTQESVLDERAAKIIEAEDIVQELVQGMLDTVIHNVGAEKADMTPAHSQALSQSLSTQFSRTFSQPCPIHIAAAPAVMDLAAVSAPLAQPHVPSTSSTSLPPAVAAQHAHLLEDSATQPVPSPNYRMDHVLADSLQDTIHGADDFGPMTLASVMSNDENLTPAVSRDFNRAAVAVNEEASVQPSEASANAEAPQTAVRTQHSRQRQPNPPRPPFWETQMTPHGEHTASHPTPPSAEQAADPSPLPIVTPATEVNALGQPLSLQQSAVPTSAGAVLHVEVITPPGGYQPQQVWENNIFSPEILSERPRSAGALGALRRLTGSPSSLHSQSAAPAVRPHGPAHLAGLRIQVPNDPLLPDVQSAPSVPNSQPASSMSTTTAVSIAQQQPSAPSAVPGAVSAAEISQAKPELPAASTVGRPEAQRQQQASSSGSVQSPEFDASFAGEAETMFNAGQGEARDTNQLQRRLRLSDIGVDSRDHCHAIDTADNQRLGQEVAQLQAANADLLQDKQEALLLLDAYRLSISQLQERHSLDAVQAKTAMAVLQAQVTKLETEKDAVEQQFNQLYHDKYYPLKESHKAAVASTQQLQEQQHQSQEQVEKLRTQLATADLKLRKSGLEAQALTQQLQQSQSHLEAQKNLTAEKDAAMEAAHAAVQRLQKQVDSDASANTGLREAQAESESLRQQVEESMRKYSTVKQARERAMSEVYAKEEEVCELQVKLQERDSALKAYKTENGRYADMKDKYKADIASLQQQVVEKEEEKATLLTMCNELMNKLEKEGISL